MICWKILTRSHIQPQQLLSGVGLVGLGQSRVLGGLVLLLQLQQRPVVSVRGAARELMVDWPGVEDSAVRCEG